MSNNVDKRVVEMQFDNKQFENGIQESVKSLDDLKKGLDLENRQRDSKRSTRPPVKST